MFGSPKMIELPLDMHVGRKRAKVIWDCLEGLSHHLGMRPPRLKFPLSEVNSELVNNHMLVVKLKSTSLPSEKLREGAIAFIKSLNVFVVAVAEAAARGENISPRAIKRQCKAALKGN